MSVLQPLLAHGPWAVGLALGVPACAKLIALMIALRGSKPSERSDIIKAVAELFRWRNR